MILMTFCSLETFSPDSEGRKNANFYLCNLRWNVRKKWHFVVNWLRSRRGDAPC